MGSIYDIKGMRNRAVDEYNKAIEVGADYEGAIAYAKMHIVEPMRGVEEIKIVTF